MPPPLILFDGMCNLCTGAVQFVIRRDPHHRFRFASLQSNAGKRILSEQHLPEADLNSFLLWEEGKLYSRSTAALRVCKKLSGLWPVLYTNMIIPVFLRDGVYNWIADNRYTWFGKKETCWRPTPELEALFIEE